VEESSGRTYNQIYEEDFLGFSYGFRPRRSQHQALDALSYALVKRKVNYVLDADIQGFFDNLDKAWMIKFIEHHRLKLTTQWLPQPRVLHPSPLAASPPLIRDKSRMR
jgi:hypothetical protein